jgi:hypothetical protein
MRAFGLVLLGVLGAACPQRGSSSTCSLGASECPNKCKHGTGIQTESCQSSADCGCGLWCSANQCIPYTGDLAGCACVSATAPPEEVTTPDAKAETSGPPDIATPETSLPACGTKDKPDDADCNPYCQPDSGCQAGEQCSYLGNNGGTGCVGIGKKGIAEACAGSTDCQAGHACIQLTSDPSATCYRYCSEDTDCPDKSTCSVNISISSPSSSFCSPPPECSPWGDGAAECGSGQSCFLQGQTTVCQKAGTKKQGEICYGEDAGACEAGLHCLVACQPICSFYETDDYGPDCIDACTTGAKDWQEVHQAWGAAICLDTKPAALCDVFRTTPCAPAGDTMCCPAGEACTPVDGGHVCQKWAGSAPQGTACLGSDTCAPGHLCLNQKCAYLCSRQEDDPAIPADQKCSTRCPGGAGTLTPDAWGIGFCE